MDFRTAKILAARDVHRVQLDRIGIVAYISTGLVLTLSRRPGSIQVLSSDTQFRSGATA